jgi:tetratricopeptide (TPR) repeat protein
MSDYQEPPTDDILKLEGAIEVCRKRLLGCELNSVEYIRLVKSLAVSLHALFQYRGGMHLLEESISLYRPILDLQKDPALDMASELNELASCLHDRHIQTSSVSDLNEAISLYRKALAAQAHHDSDASASLLGLANALTTLSRYHPFQNTLIEEAITCFRQCLSLSSSVRILFVSQATGLADALLLRYWATGEPSLLQEALDLSQSATDIASSIPWKPEFTATFVTTGEALVKRFVKAGAMDDIENAIRMFAKADNALTVTSSPDRWRPLYSWADALVHRGTKAQSVDNMSRARSLAQQAFELCPVGHFCRGRTIVALATTELYYYDLAGSEDLLHHSIALYRECISLSPTQEMPEYVVAASNLSRALHLRYRTLGQLGDLDAAIRLLADCMQSIPRTYYGYFNLIQNLANIYGARFKALGDGGDNDRTIRLRRETLELTPLEDVRRPIYLANLAYTLHNAATLRGLTEHLPEAAAVAREAIASVLPQNRYRYAGLGEVLRTAWTHGVDPNGLEDAVKMREDSLSVLPPGYPIRAEALRELANDLFARYRATNRTSDLSRCMLLYREAVLHEDSWIRDRFDAALEWIERARDVGDESFVSEAYQRAFGLLPRVAYLHLEPGQRLKTLKFIRELPGLVQSAALHFLTQGLIETAMELLEEGR